MPRPIAIIALLAACLAACGPSSTAGGGGETADQAAVSVAIPGETAAQRQFENDEIALYEKYLTPYQNAPNDIVRHQLQESWDADFCSFLSAHSSFEGWQGVVIRLSQPNITVLFLFDMGRGVSFSNDTFHDLDTSSPAYRAISSLHTGDIITISGSFAQGRLTKCDMTPTILLDTDAINDVYFNVSLSSINGASATPPPPISPTLPAFLPTIKDQQQPPTISAPPQFTAPPTNKTSFDCAKARTYAETTICSDPELAQLDRQLAVTYANAVRQDATGEVRAGGRAALAERNACRDRQCLLDWFTERNETLANDGGIPNEPGQ